MNEVLSLLLPNISFLGRRGLTCERSYTPLYALFPFSVFLFVFHKENVRCAGIFPITAGEGSR